MIDFERYDDQGRTLPGVRAQLAAISDTRGAADPASAPESDSWLLEVVELVLDALSGGD